MNREELMRLKEKAEKNLKMAEDNNNVARAEGFREQLVRINSEISKLPTEATADLSVVKEFLEGWKVEAKKFYERVREDYRATHSKMDELFTTKKVGRSTISKYSQFLTYICDKYGQGNVAIATEKWKEIDKIIEREAEAKEKAFITKVNKVVGEITDIRGLRIGLNGELNGVVIGTVAKANVSTIFAGGYNIQKLHYRVLVKKIK